MKRKILATVALACLFAYAPQPAHAGPLESLAEKVINLLQTNAKAGETFCRQGKTNIFKPNEIVVSVRSLEGNLANLSVVGEALSGIGETVCPAIDSTYMKSQFHNKAVLVLNNLRAKGIITAGDDNPQQALAEILGHRSKQLQSKICGGAAAAAGPLAQACSISRKLVGAPAA